MKKKTFAIVATLIVFSLLLLNACSTEATVVNTPAGNFEVSSFTLGVDYSTKNPSSGNEYLSVTLIPTGGSTDMDKTLTYFVKDNKTSINANGLQGSLQFISFESPKSGSSEVNTVLVFEVPQGSNKDFKPAVLTVGDKNFDIQ